MLKVYILFLTTVSLFSQTNFGYISDKEFTNINKYPSWVYDKYFTNISQSYRDLIYNTYKKEGICPLVCYTICHKESELFTKRTRDLENYAMGLGIIYDRRNKIDYHKPFKIQVQESAKLLNIAYFTSYEKMGYIRVVELEKEVKVVGHGDYALLFYNPHHKVKVGNDYCGNYTFPIIWSKYESTLNIIYKGGQNEKIIRDNGDSSHHNASRSKSFSRNTNCNWKGR